jgi:SAM-dependent methyltransferase
MTKVAPRHVRKRAFGRDPWAYDHARLRYPPRIYEVLRSRCGLRPGARVFEIGPGTGIVSRELVRRGANPLTLIEPDPRMARYLLGTLGTRVDRVRWIASPFEDARLPVGEFDLGVAATSFHWLPERRALRGVDRALRPGGWWAWWSNFHGDPYRPTSFDRAVRPVYREVFGPRRGRKPAGRTVAKDQRGHLGALRSNGHFTDVSVEQIRWEVALSPVRAAALWATFSEIATLPSASRTRFLAMFRDALHENFGTRVRIPIRTPLYTARRR